MRTVGVEIEFGGLHGGVAAELIRAQFGGTVRETDPNAWCVDATMTTKPDVLRYQDSDGTMQGTFPCFADY